MIKIFFFQIHNSLLKRAELGHHDECVAVKNVEEVSIVSQLLKVFPLFESAS